MKSPLAFPNRDPEMGVSSGDAPTFPTFLTPEPRGPESTASTPSNYYSCDDSEIPVARYPNFDLDDSGSQPVTPRRRDFRNGREARESDIFIAVMGLTGSGKSSFISSCSENHAEIGHSLAACTSAVDVYPCNFLPDRTIYLIDTPGFDNTDKSDTGVLRKIAAWMADSYQEEVLLHGIIYLHRIADIRMQGSAKRNLNLVKKLCGPDALSRVILVTTMWDMVQEEVGYSREEDLISKSEFWGSMIDEGSGICRHRYESGQEAESAKRIIKHLVSSNPAPVDLQKQLVDEQRTLDCTSAGTELQSELRKERIKWAKELRIVKKEMKTALERKDAETEDIIREAQETRKDMVKKAEEETAYFEGLIEQSDKRIAEMRKEMEDQTAHHQQELQRERNLRQQEIEQLNHIRDEKLRLQAADGRIPNPKPKDGEGFPPISASMFGSSFSIRSPGFSTRSIRGPSENEPKGTKVKLVVAGSEGSWIARYSNGIWRRSENFERQYCHLDGNFKRNEETRFEMCALGANGQYYAQWLDGNWRCYTYDNIVVEIKSVARICRKDGYKIQCVAFGYDNTYFILYGSGSKRHYKFDLKTYYPQLRQLLRENKSLKIQTIALDPTSAEDFVVVVQDGNRGYKINWACANQTVCDSVRSWADELSVM